MRAGTWYRLQTCPGAACCRATELAMLQSGSPSGGGRWRRQEGMGFGKRPASPPISPMLAVPTIARNEHPSVTDPTTDLSSVGHNRFRVEFLRLWPVD
jgi:hypothetical protein